MDSKALKLVNDLNNNIEGQCVSSGLYPVYPRASTKSVESAGKPVINDSFLEENLRLHQHAKSRPTVLKIDAPPILTQSIRKVSVRPNPTWEDHSPKQTKADDHVLQPIISVKRRPI